MFHGIGELFVIKWMDRQTDHQLQTRASFLFISFFFNETNQTCKKKKPWQNAINKILMVQNSKESDEYGISLQSVTLPHAVMVCMLVRWLIGPFITLCFVYLRAPVYILEQSILQLLLTTHTRQRNPLSNDGQIVHLSVAQ